MINCKYCNCKANLHLNGNIENKFEDINFLSTQQEIVTSKINFKPKLFKCPKCKIIFSELYNVSLVKGYEDVKDEKYIEQIEYKKLYFNNLIKKIQKYIKSSDQVLEIGSYYGAFGSEIINKVKSYEGIEMSSHACRYAKNTYKLNISNTSAEEYFKSSTKKFDIVFMFDVIEHLDDPKYLISLLKKNLNKNGKLIITTMNMDSLYAKILRKNYPWIMLFHKFYFTNKSMDIMMNDNDLKLLEIKNDVRIISFKYLFEKIKIHFKLFSSLASLLLNLKFLLNKKFYLSFFDINIWIYRNNK